MKHATTRGTNGFLNTRWTKIEKTSRPIVGYGQLGTSSVTWTELGSGPRYQPVLIIRAWTQILDETDPNPTPFHPNSKPDRQQGKKPAGPSQVKWTQVVPFQVPTTQHNSAKSV